MAERIAALVHASPVTALHTARTLRTATDAQGQRLDLWPQPGSGARLTPFASSHVVNQLLAASANDPIRSSEVVADFRRLRRGTVLWVHTQRVPLNRLMNDPDGYMKTDSTFTSQESLLAGPTLGHDLDAMVENLADADAPANVREYLRSARVILALAPDRAAEILIPFGNGFTQHIAYGEERPTASALYRVLEGSTPEIMGVMEKLSVIWRENQEALRPPTNETAAPHPCQGTNAAVPSQPPATERERGRHTPPVLSVRESALNGSAAGPPFIEESPDARHRQLSADSAGR